jgi:RHS repeat-associated protein
MLKRIFIRVLLIALIGQNLLGGTVGKSCIANKTVYTSNNDFDKGTSINVSHLIADQLSLDDKVQTFDVMWVAASGLGTIVKINTKTGEILGEYRSGPQGRSLNPSRTTVDNNGNVWAGNRNDTYNGKGSIVKIGLVENGQCIDRNGNGIIDTSSGLGDVRPWGSSDAPGGVVHAEDECILHYVRVDGTGVRHMSVDENNNVWSGGWNNKVFNVNNGETGDILSRFTPSCGGYGGLIDSNGVLWSASHSSTLRYDTKGTLYDTSDDSWSCLNINNSYGLGIDSDGNIWNSRAWGHNASKLTPGGQIIGTYSTHGSTPTGLAVDLNNNAWITNRYSSTIAKLGNDGTFKTLVTVGGNPTGAAMDADGKIWVSVHDLDKFVRIDPETDKIDMEVKLRPNSKPYNYSDMTGSLLTGKPNFGTWSVVKDSNITGASWYSISWNDFVPDDANLSIFASTSEDGISFSPSKLIEKNKEPNLSGRYVKLSIRFKRSSSEKSPVLYDLTLGASNGECCIQKINVTSKWQMLSSVCDVNELGFINSAIMKKVDDTLLVVTNNTDTKSYYETLGYDANSTLFLHRGEGFWIRGKEDGILLTLVGEEKTSTLVLKKNNTHFIGLPEYHTLNLDETFGEKPVKEIRYFESNSSTWKKWQPNHVDTTISSITNGDGFYICVADDFNISLPNLPPVVKAKHITAIVDTPVTLDARSSYDNDGYIVSYVWTEGNITLSTEPYFTKNDFTLGKHTVTLTITDNDGASNMLDISVQIVRENILPTVDLGEDKNITEEESISFYPDISDSDGYIVSYAWYVDGHEVANTPYYTVNNLLVGEHNITLEVTDNDLGKVADSITVMVHTTPDTTPPLITLIDDNPMILNVTENFDDPGASATDDKDGTLPVDINGSVDMQNTGTYILTYSAVDSAGNKASIQREVIVQDPSINQPPTVELGSAKIILKGETLRLHADANDSDGYIANYSWRSVGDVTTTGADISIDNMPLGKYTIIIVVTDDKGAKASDSISVEVIIKEEQDTTPPVITILGDNPHIMYEGDSYTDAGATAWDDKDGNVSVGFDYNITTNKAGVYIVRYYAQDKSGNKSTAFRSVLIKEKLSTSLDTTPPVITILGDNPYILVKDSNYTDLGATAFDDVDGNLSVGVEYNITTSTVGVYHVTYTAMDHSGNRATKQRSVVVQENNSSGGTVDTSAPIITIHGDNPHIMLVGENYSDAGATAYDVEDGNLSVGVEYNITTNKVGIYHVDYRAVDSSGNTVVAQRSVVVQEQNITGNNIPVMTLIGADPTILFLGEQYIDEGVIVLDAEDGQLGYTIGHNININRLGSYYVLYEATDKDGNEVNATRKVYVKDASGNKSPIANAGVDQAVGVGIEVTLDASDSRDPDGDIVSYEWREGDSILSTEASFVKNDLDFGSHTLTLTVKDNDGLSGSDTVIIRIIDSSDTTPPTAIITAPVENTKVTLQTEIIGTASDDNLDYYTLAISPVGKETYTEITRGDNSITDDVLGMVDATTLKNGIYDIKLTAFDQNGASTTAYIKVIIDGKAKIGNFSFTVTDFNMQVGGIPVQVNRTYSTLQRFEKLDFTYAWSIDYQNVKLEENIHPGKGWKVTPDVLIGSCFKTDKQHIVNVSLPDGTTESFEFKFARECGHYYVGSFYDAPILKPLNGTTATLEVIDASDSVSMNNSGEIIDGSSLQPYNPSTYRLTLANGIVYDVNQNTGIKKIKNLRDDTLTYIHDGIQSSRGESLTFTRDAQDRITKITDLAGKSVTYHYNQNNDLDYVIDQLGQKTEYHYQTGHLLEEYIDPSGLRLAKNIYDANGRLIKTIDADGNVVEFTHNIDGKEEIVKDKLGRTSVFVYDEEGNVLSQTNPMGETTTRTYDDKGRELTVIDPLGHTTTNNYDEAGNLLSVTDALGNTETTIYNDKQSPTSISDKNGNTMNIVYNAYNSPSSFTTASGATNTYTYDKYGNKRTVTNEYGEITTYLYDEEWIPYIGDVSSKGNLLKETRPDGTVIDHTYDSSANLLSTTTTLADGTSTTTSNTYDSFNRMVSTTDALGQTTTYVYDNRGNKTQITDTQNRTTTYTYNNHNKLTKTTYPDGTTETKTYDAMDNLLSETNQEGETTSYEYDGADRLIKTTYPDNTTSSSTYDKAGRVTSTTDQNGNTTTYEYDAVGNKLSQTDALHNKITFTYDAQGNMLTVTNALNKTTSYTYNTLNQRVKTTYTDNTTVEEQKNISGLPSSNTNEAGQTTSYGYDTSRAIPLLNQVTLPNSAVTQYAYDSQGKRTAQTDALGHTTSFNYKTTGELEIETLPQGEQKTFTYDATGKQIQVSDYAGKTQKFIYDAYDKLVRIEYVDGSTVTYAYTPSGRVKSITDSQGTIANTYDFMGRLKTQTTSTSSVTATISYSYDGVGNIIEIATPTQTISKTYDALNRLKTVTDDQGTVTYDYDAIGRQTKVTFANGVTTSYEYDSRNRITSIIHKNSGGDVLQSFTYTLDAVGNRTQIVEHNGRTTNYEYNSVNQLTKETVTNDPNGNDTVTTFTYDEVGNLKTKTINGTATDYSYNANDQLTTQGSKIFTYDSNGNLISDTANTYEYDDKNRLIKVTTPTDTVEYSYDVNDNRVAKTMSNGTTTYLIDTNTAYAQVITESKADGTTVEYTYGNDLLSDGSHNFLTDALGSTRGLVDSAEVLTDSYDYKAYGELSNHEGTSENGFLFTGEQFDSETQDYYLRARYYHPASTRFLSRDTYDGKLIDPLSQNHYLYAGGNPVMYMDPSGHFFGIGGMTSMLSMMTSLSTSFIMRTAGNANMFIPVAISAYHVKIGIALRNEAINSIIYVMINGGTQEAIDAAYGKYQYAVLLIQMGGLFVDSMNDANGAIDDYTNFAKAILDSKYITATAIVVSQFKLLEKQSSLDYLKENESLIMKAVLGMDTLIGIIKK